MSNLIDIQGQIEKLQKQAADIRAREFDSTVQDILAKMQAFGITIKDLEAGKRKSGKSKSVKGVRGKTAQRAKASRGSSPSKGTTVTPKYRGPNGETWTGRGLMPRWLAGLVAQGRTKEEFAISN